MTIYKLYITLIIFRKRREQMNRNPNSESLDEGGADYFTTDEIFLNNSPSELCFFIISNNHTNSMFFFPDRVDVFLSLFFELFGCFSCVQQRFKAL